MDSFARVPVVGGRPAESRVHRASGLSLRGPQGRAAGGEVSVAGLTVSVDEADGEGSVSDAAVLLAATAWGRAWRLALGGSLGRLLDILLHMPLHLTLFGEFRNPTSQRCLGNYYETLHLTHSVR